MISRFLCGVFAVAMAGPCLGQVPSTPSRPVDERPPAIGAFGMTVAENLHVTSVEPGSAADEMGLKDGDAIRDLNGLGFGGPEQFGRVLKSIPVGKPVRMVVSRNGSQVRLTGRMDQKTIDAAAVPMGQTAMRQDSSYLVSNGQRPVVSGVCYSGCGNCGSSCGCGYSSCGPCGMGPGTQWLTCGPVYLDLSNHIGMSDPCNCWGPHPGYGKGWCW